jgi:hypothetical protein
MVWLTKEIQGALRVSPSGLERSMETVGVFALAAAIFYLSETADTRGRYSSVLRYPLLFSPASDLEAELPEDGGVLYSADMGAFYAIFHRFPNAKFKFVLAMESGFMPPDDLKVLRAIQFSSGRLEEYKPWFNRMTDKDRVFLQQDAKPEWPGFEFRKVLTGWMGRKNP